VEIFTPFIEDINSFKEREIISGQWAPYECLLAMARVVKRDFVIIIDTDQPDYVSNFFNDSNFPPIFVSHENGNHFCVLYPITGRITVGYPSDAPIIPYLQDRSLTLSALKRITKYEPSKRAAYPSFLSPLPLWDNSKLITKRNLLPKTYTQPVLSFRKKEGLAQSPRTKTIRFFLIVTVVVCLYNRNEEVVRREENLQEIIDKLAKILTGGPAFTDERSYITVDNNIKRTCILSFEEIADFVTSEGFENARSHIRHIKDAKLNIEGFLILLYVNIFKHRKEKDFV
jgi:hypothetical protein